MSASPRLAFLMSLDMVVAGLVVSPVVRALGYDRFVEGSDLPFVSGAIEDDLKKALMMTPVMYALVLWQSSQSPSFTNNFGQP